MEGGASGLDRRFWVDGDATTGAWTCEADAVQGYGLLGDTRELAVFIGSPLHLAQGLGWFTAVG